MPTMASVFMTLCDRYLRILRALSLSSCEVLRLLILVLSESIYA
ncbi:hypothetical protein FG05_35139 [Fusarium graminearum]|nr:hypothetical protein FG05_35139 [Fusarium graminearum]